MLSSKNFNSFQFEFIGDAFVVDIPSRITDDSRRFDIIIKRNVSVSMRPKLDFRPVHDEFFQSTAISTVHNKIVDISRMRA